MTLISSENLRHWSLRSMVLHHPDVSRGAFQYLDWQFEGEDMIVVSRTAYEYEDEWGGHSPHDSNFITFHRIRDFRKLRGKNSIVDPAAIPLHQGRVD